MKTIARISLPLAAALLLAGCQASPQDQFAKAQASFAARDFVAARIAVSAALQGDPGNREMLMLLARAQLALGDGDAAEAAIDRLTAAGGSGPEVEMMKARLALLQNRPADALKLAAGNTTPQGWAIRASAHLGLGQTAEAITAFQQGMAAGDDIGLATDYARYLLQTDQPDAVVPILARMQATAPKAYETQVLVGDLAVARGQTDAAITAYRNVIKNFPDRVDPYLALANQLDEKGKVDEAMAELAKAEKLGSSSPDVQSLKVQLLSEKGDWEEIRDTLQTQESTLDPSSGIGMTYAEAMLRLGHAEQARMLFARAMLVIPNNPYARMMLGESQLATGDAAGAWTTLKPLAQSTLADGRILELAEKAARESGAPEAGALRTRLEPQRLKAMQALARQGQAAMDRADWNAAIPIYEKLLAAGPDPEVLKRLALASSRLGRGDAAIAYADKALALQPTGPDYLYMAGLVRLNARKDLSGAVRYLQAAVSTDPRNAILKRDLEKAKAAAG